MSEREGLREPEKIRRYRREQDGGYPLAEEELELLIEWINLQARLATAKAQVAQGEMREREILADVKILIEGHPLAERTQGARVRLLVWLRDRPSETSTPQEPHV